MVGTRRLELLTWSTVSTFSIDRNLVDSKAMGKIAYLECSRCGHKITPEQPQTVCPKDDGALFVRYDLRSLRQKFSRDSLQSRVPSIWRYKDVLPGERPITLGEGMTPLIPLRTFSNVLIKDESRNPTASFKARGLSVGVTMAQHYGLKKLVLPSAGNAASALSCYCAFSGIEAHIFMPKDVPLANLVECRTYGAHITLVDGSLADCVQLVHRLKDNEGWFDITSLKEPFRLEGKKTMGYEIAQQLQWDLPDAIIFPTGGGVGVVGLWKAFEEMEELGWIGPRRPKMISVQAEGCAPIVRAWNKGMPSSDPWQNARTVAAGLRVPRPFGDYLVLAILRKSYGAAVAVNDKDILMSIPEMASGSGVFPSPEGAASLAAYKTLVRASFLKPTDTVILFNTGSALKYVNLLSQAS